MNGEASLFDRLFSRRGAVLLARNTVVSTIVFLLGLALLWLMVERLGVAKVPAAGLSFLCSNSIHYVFGRTWIYRGTDRTVAEGYAYFLINAALGLGITVGVFAAFIELGLHYLLARVVAFGFRGAGTIRVERGAEFSKPLTGRWRLPAGRLSR